VVRTHQTNPRSILRERGIELHEVDLIVNELDQPLAEGEPIIVHKAKACMIEADGRVTLHYTHSQTPRDVLAEAGIRLGADDTVLVDGARLDAADPLPSPGTSERGTGLRSSSLDWANRTLHLLIRRAIPISVVDGAITYSLLTTAPTLAESLLEAGITLYQADQVSPHLMSAILPGMRVLIQRSKPLTIQADSRLIATRTRLDTVDDVLAQEGIGLGLKDYALPDTDTPVSSNLKIRVVRVQEELVYQDQPIEFETLWQADPQLEIDHRRVTQSGEEGVERRRVRIHYEDGIETYRVEEETWTALAPITRVIAYGTKIVERELDTAQGPIRYWRKLRVKATSYTPATCGKAPDHPQYGITRLGWQATKGIIAVDPRVISLRTEMYVPGYGFGTAADTGGAIKWRRIDLCYDVDNLVLWKKWVDVYLLSPPPSPEEIHWIVPNWPPES